MTNTWLLRRGDLAGQLRNGLDRAFTDSFGGLWSGLPVADRRFSTWGRRFPAINVWETESSLHAEAELPGLKMEDLEILVKGNELMIKGERKHLEQEGIKYHRRERGTGPFRGVVQLPADIDVDKVEATLENGVLTVRMPKSEKARPRKIEVKARTR